jgi:hypothetical protein
MGFAFTSPVMCALPSSLSVSLPALPVAVISGYGDGGCTLEGGSARPIANLRLGRKVMTRIVREIVSVAVVSRAFTGAHAAQMRALGITATAARRDSAIARPATT